MKTGGNIPYFDKLRRRAEAQLKKKNSKGMPVSPEADTIKLIHELEVQQIELELQNKELLNSQSSERVSSDKYVELYDFAPSAYFTLSIEGEIIEMNLAGSQLLGRARSYLNNSSFGVFVADSSKQVYNNFFKKVFKSKTKESCEVTLCTSGNLSVTVLLSAIVAGNDKHCLLNCVDITHKKQSEEFLRKSEENYRIIADNTYTWEFWLSPDNNFIYVSPAFERITGYPVNSIIQNPQFIYKIIHPDDREIYEEHLKQSKSSVNPCKFSFRIINSDGDTRFIEHTCKQISDNEGNYLGTRGSNNDITERMLAEASMSESLEKYGTLFLSMEEGVIFYNGEGNITEVNPSALNLLGLTYDELIGFSPRDPEWKIFHEDGSFFREEDYPSQVALRTGQKTEAVAGISLPVKKEIKWIKITATPKKKNNEEHPSRVFVTLQDITYEIDLQLNQKKLNSETIQHSLELEKRIKDRIIEIMQLSNINKAVVDNMGLALITTSADGIIKTFNHEAEKQLGYDADEVVGKLSPYAFHKPEELEEKRKSLKAERNSYFSGFDLITEISEELHGVAKEWTMKKKDGTEIFVLLSITSLYDLEGFVTGYIGVFIDITHQKETENELRISEARWQSALEGSRMGIRDWNVLTGEVYFSNQWKTILGYNEEEVGNKLSDWEKRVHPDDLKNCYDELKRHFAGETEYYTFEARMLCKDKTYKWVHDRGKVFEWKKKGSPWRVIGTLTDINERKKLEKSLLESLVKEKELNELKNKFVSTASHEFRTPLASILITSDSLITYWDRMDATQIRDKLSKINNQVFHLTKIVNDVLHISKIEGGRVEFNPVDLDIVELCKQTVETFNSDPDLPNKVKLESPYRSVIMRLDTRLMIQVINNLISNGIKYAPQNPKVKVEISRNKDELCISVSDNGIGIPQPDQKHLFTPFFRGTNTGQIQGNGLGLSIVKESVRLHGGHITFTSKEDHGTKFVLHFPGNLIINYD